MSEPQAPLIFVIAGEPSGDEIGGRLIAALQAATGGEVRLAGIGGEAMAAHGLESLFPMTELAVMGLVEVLPRAAAIIARMAQTAREIRRLRPDVVVSIDAPGFAGGVWRRLRGSRIPLVHYVAPTVWAWRPGRARKLARRIDHLLTLLPFEPAYFEAEGLACTFVGHPALESGADAQDRGWFRDRHGLGDGPVLGILPGSRKGEISRLLPVMGRAVAILAAGRPGLSVVVPAVAAHAGRIEAAAASWPVRTIVSADRTRRFAAMAACDVAIAASGTVTLELAQCGVPMVVGYRVNPLTAALVRRMVRVDYVTIINLILGRESIPELLNAQCRAEALAEAADRLFDYGAARAAQLADARAGLAALRRDGMAPSERAAEVILQIARERRTPAPDSARDNAGVDR